MSYTNDDLANLIKVQADRICQEVRAASEPAESPATDRQQRQQEIVASLNEASDSVNKSDRNTANYHIKEALRQLLA